MLSRAHTCARTLARTTSRSPSSLSAAMHSPHCARAGQMASAMAGPSSGNRGFDGNNAHRRCISASATAAAVTDSTAGPQLQVGTMNPKIVAAEYAVRGEIVLKAMEYVSFARNCRPFSELPFHPNDHLTVPRLSSPPAFPPFSVPSSFPLPATSHVLARSPATTRRYVQAARRRTRFPSLALSPATSATRRRSAKSPSLSTVRSASFCFALPAGAR